MREIEEEKLRREDIQTKTAFAQKWHILVGSLRKFVIRIPSGTEYVFTLLLAANHKEQPAYFYFGVPERLAQSPKISLD